MKKVYFLLYTFLLSMGVTAQTEKFSIEFKHFKFKNLKENIQFTTSYTYPEQVYCEVEFEIVNKTKETLTQLNILQKESSYIAVEYDKVYKLEPLTNNMRFYEKISFRPEFTDVSFDSPWRPNKAITFRLVFAKIVELDFFNFKKATDGFASTLRKSHLNYPPKDAFISLYVSAKGVYGKEYKQNVGGKIKSLVTLADDEQEEEINAESDFSQGVIAPWDLVGKSYKKMMQTHFKKYYLSERERSKYETERHGYIFDENEFIKGFFYGEGYIGDYNGDEYFLTRVDEENKYKYLIFRKNDVIIDVLDMSIEKEEAGGGCFYYGGFSTFYVDGNIDKEIIGIGNCVEEGDVELIKKTWRASKKVGKIISIPTTGITLYEETQP